ncbi:hypothetical protein ACEPT7_00660 [Burkholderia ubonensis]|uniref:hypothetical protein n=1 Tax=Burkholderia ubonensis TaxID=101571 RepID=UPI00358DDE96
MFVKVAGLRPGHWQTKREAARDMTTTTLPAGGRATEAGMAFQAGVGMWFAAHLLAKMPIGSRFGLDVAAYPVTLQLETGQGLDDIVVTLSNGGRIAVQCKTRPSLSASETSDLGETIGQTVQFVATAPTLTPALDLHRSAAVMAVATDAPATLNALDEVCRMFATGDDWQAVYARVSQAQRGALDILRGHVARGRAAASLPPPTEMDLAQLARLFHIGRFAVAQGEADWREASNILGARIFGGEEFGPAPLMSLLAIIRSLIRNGAPSDRDGLLRQLRAAGHEDTRSPQFDEDIAALRGKTQSEMARLQRHAVLPIAGGVPIERACMPALKAAADAGSFLVVGEPGAGKTGVLVAFAQERLAANHTTIFISVDDLAGVATDDALRIALNLQHSLVDVLFAWPGRSRGVLVIDALDASRGGYSEAVFASVIEIVQARLGDRWSVVASIRSFDLKNGRRFRRAMAGTPPEATYIDSTAADVRHFLIPALTNDETSGAGRREARIGELLATAPASVRRLLHNVFNLSLAAELLDGGTTAASIVTVTTQSDLIDRYEDERLPSTDLQASVARAVEVMVDRRRLILRKIDVAHPALDGVLAAGVLVAAGDRVGFAHHVLFDHAAGRYFLDWNDTSRLVIQMSGTEGLGLLLGPSLRFAIERIWREDSPGRPLSWRLTTDLVATTGLDPVVSSAALRSTTERVAGPEDVASLCSMLIQPGQAGRLGPILSKLVRFAGLSLAESGSISDSVATAWANVAAAAADMQQCEYADGVRIILLTLFEKANFADAGFLAGFGRAARGLLTLTWSDDPRLAGLSGNAIRFVAKAFGSDPEASRQLLQQILDEPRFSEHAHDEAPWLAEGVKHIVPHDPAFVTSVYAALFGRPAPSDGDSWMGGTVSRILPLRSNRRQDYEHGRWNLQQTLPAFLRAFPAEATRAVNAATIGISLGAGTRYADRPMHVVQYGTQSIRIAEDGLSYTEWRGSDDRTDRRDAAVLSAFVSFLSTCQPDEFRQAVVAAQQEAVGSASVWARILGIAADRAGVADDLLWPIASTPEVGRISDLARDCATYLSSAYATASVEQRTALENLLVERARLTDEDEAARTRYCAARLLSVLRDDLIVTATFRELKAQLLATGDLTGNRPMMTIENGWGAPSDITESLVRSGGANVDEGPDRQVLDARRALDVSLKEASEHTTTESLAGLWAHVLATVETIDGLTVPAHEATLHAAWGNISNALDRIAGAEQYDPEKAEHPTLAALVGLLDRLAQSAYPEPRSNGDRVTMSWGNWDVRVYVASSLMDLARRFGATDTTLLDRIEAMLDDVEPTVRHQVSGSLNRLWDVDCQRMWALMTKVAQQEVDRCVMGFFVHGPLSRVATADAERAESVLATVIQRFPLQGGSDSNKERELEQALGAMATGLYVGQGRAACRAHLHAWLPDIADASDLLWSAVSTLREALFLKYKESASDGDGAIQDRAREVLGLVVAAAASSMPAAFSTYNASLEGSEERVASEREYRAAVSLLEHCVNQLYFGAGAFADSNGQHEIVLDSPASKRSFLIEYQTILFEIGQSGGPAATHHLVELYEFIADGDPATVFDQVAALLVGPAAREGYHFESLGLDVVVRIVRRYLADHRDLFENPARRSALIGVLELFSNAGWPEALKLLYELPDLMR